MKIKIKPGKARGSVLSPASKSMAHRLLICAAMANGISYVKGVSSCDDVRATIECLSALGVKFEKIGNDYKVCGTDMRHATPTLPLYCRESGSTARMLIPIVALSGNEAIFTAEPGLLQRPMSVYEELFARHGMLFEKNASGYRVKGPISPGEYTVRADVSSQFISGLIFALAAFSEPSTIHLLPPIESKSYILMTLGALGSFGAKAYFSDSETIVISGGGYTPCDVSVEGDYSGAAFIDALTVIGGNVHVEGLNADSAQADRVYTDLFARLKGGAPRIDLSDCPDLAPILFALAAALNGAEFTGTSRLKIKESDRASVMAEELSKLGAEVTVRESSVTVKPSTLHPPKEPISSHGDHRIAMAMSILLTLTGGEIDGCEAVSKSYPEFFEHLTQLGINIEIF